MEQPELLENIAEKGNQNEAIGVMLVDDHEAMREGLHRMLSGDGSIRVIGEARDGQEALSQVKSLSPDVILMDVNMPRMDGIETTRHLKEARLPMSIIILADDHRYMAPAIKAGAVGFLTRNVSRSELIAAIRVIHLWRLGLLHNKKSHFALVKL